MSLTERPRTDACPGALRLHDAADGALARVRIPGGRVTGPQLRALVDLAVGHGDGHLDVTSRGNVQIRGLAPDAAPRLAERLHRVGLLPSAAHERVRNIHASPLAGLDDRGHGPLGDLVAALDAAVCAEPRLAEVSGRYLWALDDGRGDVVGAADAAWFADTAQHGRLVLAGADTGIVVPRGSAAEVLRDATLAFLDLGTGWRLRDEPDSVRQVAAAVPQDRPQPVGGPPRPLPQGGPAALGPVSSGARATAVVAAVPMGRLTAAQAALLADVVGADPLLVTPWRSVVVPGEAVERLTQAGLVCTPGSPWPGVTACAGMPSCAKALADVRADAARSVEAARDRPSAPHRRVHWSGCERRCGRPEGEHLEVVALPDGSYSVSDAREETVMSAEHVARRVAALRDTRTTP